MGAMTIMHEPHVASPHLCECQSAVRKKGESQWVHETECKIREWLSWVGRRELDSQSRSWRHPREPRPLSPQATRNEFRKQLNPSAEKHRGRRWMSRRNGMSRLSLPSLGFSITWYLPLAIACICATSLRQT